MGLSTIESAVNATAIGANSLGFTQAETILRCRGYVTASMDSTKQAGDEMTCTFGLGIFSSDAFALGATAMPEPSSDAVYPWLWWAQMHLHAEITGGTEAWGLTQQILQVDSKAMRRVKPSQTLGWVVQFADAAGAPATDVVFGQVRVLVGS